MMKKYILLGLIIFVAAIGAAEIAIGQRIPGSELLNWQTQGTTVKKGNDGLYDAAIIPASSQRFCRASAQLPDNALNKCYELTVNAASSTSSAQILAAEGFIWGSSQKVKRLIRLRLAGDNEYAEYKMRFKVEAVPFYLNFGIHPDTKGEIRVAWLELKEIAETELDEHMARNAEFPKDMNRYEMLLTAQKRCLETRKKLQLPVPEELAQLKITNDETVLDEVDRIIGKYEKITVIAGQEENPDSLKAELGALKIKLANRHAPHSVWARLELADNVEYRQVAPNGAKFRLNQADAVSLPPGEAVEIEISGITAKGELKIIPLDHFASDTWNIIKIEL